MTLTVYLFKIKFIKDLPTLKSKEREEIMKKCLALTLALVLALGCTACGGSEKKETKAETTAAAESGETAAAGSDTEFKATDF